jgi:hypothetical protein
MPLEASTRSSQNAKIALRGAPVEGRQTLPRLLDSVLPSPTTPLLFTHAAVPVYAYNVNAKGRVKGAESSSALARRFVWPAIVHASTNAIAGFDST